MLVLVLPGSGQQSRACRDNSAVRMESAGLHSFFKMSRQIAPVWLEMFGCQIFVSNFILYNELISWDSYLRGLVRVLTRKHDVNRKFSSLVGGVLLQNKSWNAWACLGYTGPRMKPFQWLMLSPTIYTLMLLSAAYRVIRWVKRCQVYCLLPVGELLGNPSSLFVYHSGLN